MSVQKKCIFEHSKNRKGYYDLGWSVLQTQSVFWCNGKQEEGIIESHCIYTHIDVVAEVLEVHSSVYFEFCIYEEFIELWWADIMFKSPHTTNFSDFPLSNGGDLLLARTTVLCYGGFGESLWVGNHFKALIWYVIYVVDDASIALKSSVSFIIFSSDSCLLAFIYWLLASIAACMMKKCLSELLSILLLPFGIMKLEVRRTVSKK